MTEYAHIAPQFREVMVKTDLERLDFLEQSRWIDYPAAQKLRAILDGMLRVPERTRMPNLLLVGPSNSGKTSVVSRFRDTTGNTLHIPLVLVGTRTALQLLMLDPQYTSRFEVVALPEWKVNPELQAFLKAFESVLPLKKPSRLFSPDLTTLIHAISDGNTGNIGYICRPSERLN